jgi:uncharacterized lipoprotein NlpE involved in copper resistance
MKKGAIALILCVTVLGALGCNNRQAEKNRKRQQAEAQSQRTTQAIGDLARAHNAVVDWKKGLAAKEPLGRIFSAELAPVLVRPDGRPLLFIADVLDVSSKGGDYICDFEAYVTAIQKMELILACTHDQANELMHDSEAKYAVVAQVTSVGAGALTTGESADERRSASFPVYGKCLGQVSVGKDYIDDLMEVVSFPDNKNQP